MEKYQVYYYYSRLPLDLTPLYWSYAGLAVIFVTSVSILIYLQHTAVKSVKTETNVSDNYVQWHLEEEIARDRQKTRMRKGKGKKSLVGLSIISFQWWATVFQDYSEENWIWISLFQIFMYNKFFQLF